MKPLTKTILKSFDKAYKIQPVSRLEIETFKTNYIQLIDRVEESEQNNESEENFKGHLMDFLKNTYFQKNHLVAPKGKTDFVIHASNEGSSPAAILFEVKRPKNTAEMVSRDNLNTKAMQELMLYYFEERSKHQNNDITHLVITNIHEWFIFDSNTFERLFYKNGKTLKEFKDWKDGKKVSRNNDLFYNEIAKPALNAIEENIEFTYFDIRNYEKNVRNADLEDDKNTSGASLIHLYKIFSPTHLLKLQVTNDNNKLNNKFYTELLHIIGLEEVKNGGKKLIQRKESGKRDEGSLLENCINIIESEERLHHVKDLFAYGKGKEEQLFNIGLELCITWVNRILFLKLLEAQLQKYHDNNPHFRFLNNSTIRDFDVLNKLFFQVLAKPIKDRSESIQAQFSRIPYLNSSLFDISTLEDDAVRINSLDDSLNVPLLKSSVLRNNALFKDKKQVNTLNYLFAFLNAYDFSSENKEDIVEENRELISASVLGLIFEKINGYRDGSFYTPAFITEYMCKETITKAVLQKFNDAKAWNCSNLTDLHNKIEDIQEANQIFDSLHICDPAVGSGHFLVSALNALIFIKSELGILKDRNGKRLKGYQIEVINDELIVLDEEEKVFEYKVLPNGKINTEIQRVQETLFHEKQTLIENCLFGVDINPNSVKICRLRLWIELLKNAYYQSDEVNGVHNPMRDEPNKLKNTNIHHSSLNTHHSLQTLPNIDINIKQGNSLLSRFALNEDLSEVFQKQKFSLKTYRDAVQAYKNSKSKEAKTELLRFINEIKDQFKESVSNRDPRRKQLSKLRGERMLLDMNVDMFGNKKLSNKDLKTQKTKLEDAIDKIQNQISDIEENNAYKGSFEWRFEFPEILDDKGDFVGFDVIIGNPPYFSLSKIKEFGSIFEKNYFTYSKSSDIYCLFYEKAIQILKNQGIATYITSNSWLKTQYGESLRIFFENQTNPLILINIEDAQIFEEATVESNIMMIQKGNFTYKLEAVSLKNDFKESNSVEKYFNANKLIINNLDKNGWNIGNESENILKLKIETGSKLLKDWNIQINRGFTTGFNEAFFIDSARREELIKLDPKCSELFKPSLRGRDMKKYSFDWANIWIIIIKSGWTNKNRNGKDAESFFKDFYPSIYNHLKNAGDTIQGKGKGLYERDDKGDYWWELRPCVYYDEFEKDKIVWGELSDEQKFTIDKHHFYANNTIFFFTGENLEYYLSILNSKLAKWYFELISTTSGVGTNRWLKYKIEQFPIKDISETSQAPIIAKVEQILSLKKADPSTDTRQLEAEIDAMVYQLYDLTTEEIAIVENSIGSSKVK